MPGLPCRREGAIVPESELARTVLGEVIHRGPPPHTLRGDLVEQELEHLTALREAPLSIEERQTYMADAEAWFG